MPSNFALLGHSTTTPKLLGQAVNRNGTQIPRTLRHREQLADSAS